MLSLISESGAAGWLRFGLIKLRATTAGNRGNFSVDSVRMQHSGRLARRRLCPPRCPTKKFRVQGLVTSKFCLTPLATESKTIQVDSHRIVPPAKLFPMAPRGHRNEPLRPILPGSLLKQMGMGDDAQNKGRPRVHRQATRKELRKQERVQKRQRSVPTSEKSYQKGYGAHSSTAKKSKPAPSNQSPASSKNPPRPKAEVVSEPNSDDDFNGFSEGGEEDGEEKDDDDVESEDDQSSKPIVSKADKDRLAKEDAEIAKLEKKLGIKNRKSLHKSFHEDGLEELLGDLDGESEDEDWSAKRKRKTEADEWLAQKRRKATHQTADDSNNSLDDQSDLGDASDPEEDGDSGQGDLGSNDDDLHDMDSDIEKEEKLVRKRENPYVAPTPSKTPAPKYVLPARRQDTGSDAELLSRIRRQTQGLINRLTESNLLAILSDIEGLYRDYPRQHVTFTLIDLLLIQIAEPTSLPDTLVILNAGFSTAVYQVIGPDFGAQLIQQAVERFKQYYAEVSEGDAQNVPKHTTNLITFLSEMYNFQLLSCNLIFDYIRLLLSDLTEHNAELLLRIVRMAGQSLRRDDPLALKDIVALIGPAVKTVGGEANLSVRTKFMIETIDDLKNNKAKAGAKASAVVQDHTTRMKKLLGSLNTRKLKATEPLHIGLNDIEDSNKRGKWWLIGASWAGRDEASEKQRSDRDAGNDGHGADVVTRSTYGEDADSFLPDLDGMSKEQGMNTDVRRAIFIAIMGAGDYEDAYARLMKLRLNNNRTREIPSVVLHCAGCEEEYNPYYGLVARRVCGNNRVKFAFKASLWKYFRRLGEPLFGAHADDDDADDAHAGDKDDAICTRRIFAVANVFSFLVANGVLGLDMLKCLNLAYVQTKTRDFLTVMFIKLFLELSKKEDEVVKIFRAVSDLPDLSKALWYFLKKVVRKSDLVASKKDKKKVTNGCEIAVEALTGLPEVEAAGGVAPGGVAPCG